MHDKFWEISDLSGEISLVHLAPNLLSFSSAISACEKAGQWQLALHLLDATSTARICPDVIIHSATWKCPKYV